MVISGKHNNGRVAKAWKVGKGLMKNVEECEEVNGLFL